MIRHVPFSVKQNDSRCPTGKKWSVVNSDTGDLKGCHESEASAKKQQKALYANVPDADRSDEPENIPGKIPLPAAVMYTTPSTQVW